MRAITVRKADLLAILHVNRDRHRDVFLEAQEKYREMVISELDKMLEDARNDKRIRTFIELIEPLDYTKEYDRIIGMLELDTSDSVELNQTEYSQYVQDDWGWKEQWVTANSTYTASARSN